MSSVKLYVYDLSNGMARQLSQQLTGRQIDGIWHTSIVVFGKEVFYGQGITITAPGRSHHGQPLRIIDIGETALDEETFNEYLQEVRAHYSADKYHLLEFNCNSFTDDCAGFLTGQSIPAYIKDLPHDFLSTPFGQALRPTIDAMFRRPAANASVPPPNTGPNPQLAASILQGVATQAQYTGSESTNSLASPMHVITNPASFNNFLKTHRAAVAFFTSATCPPCRVMEPVFERLAEEKGAHGNKDGAGFSKIDIGVGLGRNLAAEWGIRATPTFMFFLDGKKLEEMKGADANELKTQIDLLLYTAYPPHAHTSLSLPSIQALSLKPIIFNQVPNLETVFNRICLFIDEAAWPDPTTQTKEEVKNVLSGPVLVYLRSRFVPIPGTPSSSLPSASATLLNSWTQATATMAIALPADTLFPIVDMWRIAFLDQATITWMLSNPTADPIRVLLPKAIETVHSSDKGGRNFVLTVLRLLCNAFGPNMLGKTLLKAPVRAQITEFLIPSLLHSDSGVRTAAAGLAFDASAVTQRERVDSVRRGIGIKECEGDFADWEVEMISAIVEAIDREKENEDVVHRLVAALACLLRFSPHYDSQIEPLLEALQSQQVLMGKLTKGAGWNLEGGIAKREIRRLVEEVAAKLCV